MTTFGWIAVVCIAMALVLTPPRYDPAIRLKEFTEEWPDDGYYEAEQERQMKKFKYPSGWPLWAPLLWTAAIILYAVFFLAVLLEY